MINCADLIGRGEFCQRFFDLLEAILCRRFDGRLSRRILLVQVGSSSTCQQLFHCFDMAIPCRQGQCCQRRGSAWPVVAKFALCPHFCPLFHQKFDDARVTIFRCIMQRGPVVAVFGVDIGFHFDQHFHSVYFAMDCSKMQRCKCFVGPLVHINSQIDQEFHRPSSTICRCQHQWSHRWFSARSLKF